MTYIYTGEHWLPADRQLHHREWHDLRPEPQHSAHQVLHLPSRHRHPAEHEYQHHRELRVLPERQRQHHHRRLPERFQKLVLLVFKGAEQRHLSTEPVSS